VGIERIVFDYLRQKVLDFSYLVPKRVTIIYFAPDCKRRIEMDNSESGDDLGNNFLTVESQSYMVQGEDLDGKVMFIAEGHLWCAVNCIRILWHAIVIIQLNSHHSQDCILNHTFMRGSKK
jgi:hypothetical protein